jgi:hypothetical protein
MMTTSNVRLRHVVDWRAALWAGLSAGAIFLIALLIIYPLATGGSPWIVLRFLASIVLGQEALVPANTFDAGVALVALLVNFVLAVIYTLIIAFIVHRWGILLSIILGGLIGLAFYLINFFAFTFLFEWFAFARAWPFLVVHVLFGAAAGGIYELLEQDMYVIDRP